MKVEKYQINNCLYTRRELNFIGFKTRVVDSNSGKLKITHKYNENDERYVFPKMVNWGQDIA
ncbi:MAG: hypothetical protein GY793_01390 [Proteobacteria bacterium]|nr:hypothetical protein [Pseudomonadota bacterium]